MKPKDWQVEKSEGNTEKPYDVAFPYFPHWLTSLEPRTSDRALVLGEGFLGELDRVLVLGEGFLRELKLVLDLVEGFLEELVLVLVLIKLFCLLVQQLWPHLTAF
jgi:hypothetical protein